MQYRVFGKRGIKLSALGFGAMRLPMKGDMVDEEKAVAVIRKAYELGVNYFDTGYYYCNRQSERVVGKALKDVRDKVYLSTKNPLEDTSGANYRNRLERSLQEMDVEYIDFYQAMWGANWKDYEEKFAIPGGGMAEALKAKEEGLIRHICFSFHDTLENLIKLLDTGFFEGVTLQYNLLDRSNEAGIAYAHKKGLGVIVMGPVGGGRLGVPSEVIQKMIPGGIKSSAEVALRFVLANPGVTVALSGMNTIEMVEENAAVASRTEPLTEEEKRRIAESLKELQRLSDLYCTGCNYCMPCPHDVNIPENFRLMNLYRVYALKNYAVQEYQKLGMEGHQIKGLKAELCQECGECEEKCPQKISIMNQLKEVARVLGRK